MFAYLFRKRKRWSANILKRKELKFMLIPMASKPTFYKLRDLKTENYVFYNKKDDL